MDRVEQSQSNLDNYHSQILYNYTSKTRKYKSISVSNLLYLNFLSHLTKLSVSKITSLLETYGFKLKNNKVSCSEYKKISLDNILDSTTVSNCVLSNYSFDEITDILEDLKNKKEVDLDFTGTLCNLCKNSMKKKKIYKKSQDSSAEDEDDDEESSSNEKKRKIEVVINAVNKKKKTSNKQLLKQEKNDYEDEEEEEDENDENDECDEQKMDSSGNAGLSSSDDTCKIKKKYLKTKKIDDKPAQQVATKRKYVKKTPKPDKKEEKVVIVHDVVFDEV